LPDPALRESALPEPVVSDGRTGFVAALSEDDVGALLFAAVLVSGLLPA
jgi:hypothetical protein